jgi:hypothetical protein
MPSVVEITLKSFIGFAWFQIYAGNLDPFSDFDNVTDISYSLKSLVVQFPETDPMFLYNLR